MRLLSRDKVQVSYALFSSKSPITDSEGRKTGEYSIEYSEPVGLMASVSPESGSSRPDLFGTDISYSRVLLTDASCPIDENAIVFVDVTPCRSGGQWNNDYVVSKVATSLNFRAIALRRSK